MSKINNYEELMVERKRLEVRIVDQKEILNNGLLELKAQIQPLLGLRNSLTLFENNGTGLSLLNAIASTGIDLIAGQGLSPKVKWLARLAMSFITSKFLPRASNKLNSGAK